MEQPLEEALELTDDIIDTVQQQPSPARPTPSGEKSLHEKLYAIYVEECEKESEVEGLTSNVKLLEKLMKKESLSCLVVNLYPENQGYSLMIKDKDGVLVESFPVPYVGPKLLKYLDAEELPPFLIDVLEKSPVNVFHHGCVIAEIRDYRQGSNIYPPGELGAEPAVLPAVSPPAYQSRHILLHPTMQSLVSDVHSITSDNQQWAEEEKLEPESQLISASAEPLCLEPSVAVTHMASRLLFNEQKMMTDSLRQCFMRQEWPYLEQDDEQHICTTPPDVDTMVTCRKQAEIKPGDKYDLKIAEAGKCVDTWKQRPCELVAPEEVDVHKYARGKPSVPLDDSKSTAWSTPEVNFDDIFDCEEGSQPWETKSSMTQSFSDPFLSPEIDSSTEGRSDKQLFLPQVAPSDCSLGSPAGEMIESGKAMGACQGSVQSKAECLGTMLQRSTDSISLGQSSLGIESGKAVGACQGSVQSRAECLGIMLQRSTDSISLGQSSPGKRAIPHVVASPVLERRVRTTGPLLTPPSSSGRGFLADNRPSVSLRGKKLPRLVLSSRSASSAQQAFSGMRSVNTLSPPVQPSASSSESNPATQGPSSGTGQNVFNLFSLAQGAPVLMSSPSQVQRFPTGAPASTETSSRGFFAPRAQMPSTRPRAPHRSVHTSLKLIVKNTSGPVTVRLPPGSVILHPESQAQQQQPRLQPQQPQQQPQLQLQQPRQPQQQPHLQSQQPQQQPWLLPQQQQPWLLPQQQQQPWLLPQQQQQPWLLPQQPQQQSQSQLHSQPQQQPERLYVLIPKPQQPPRAPVPRQPVPPACSLGSNIPQRVLLAQQVRLFNLAEARRIFQPQTTVVCQVGSTHQRLGQNLPSQSFQHPAAQVEQLQARGHNVQLRFLPRIVAVPRAPTQHSHQGCTGGQCRCRGRGGPPTPPNF